MAIKKPTRRKVPSRKSIEDFASKAEKNPLDPSADHFGAEAKSTNFRTNQHLHDRWCKAAKKRTQLLGVDISNQNFLRWCLEEGIKRTEKEHGKWMDKLEGGE